jgi:glucose uptake protein
MILPQSYVVALAVLIGGLLLAGSWAVTYKLTRKWRFELYSLDFALGALVIGLVAAFTLGNLGYDGFSIGDDITNSSKHSWLFAFVAGAAFSLGNMLTLGSASISGMGMPFSIALGVSTLLGLVLPQMARDPHRAVVAAGIALVVVALGAIAVAQSATASKAREEARAAGVKETALPAGGARAVILAVIGGFLMAASIVLSGAARGVNGVGPYALGIFFTGAVFLSTLLFSMFFMNLPVQGDPLGIRSYLKASRPRHGLATLGGVLWFAGALALWTVTAAPANTQLSRGAGIALVMVPPIVAAIWGLLLREYSPVPRSARAILAVAYALYAAGVALIATV